MCSICGGRVEWQGRLSNLTHTKCLDCGALNSQEPEDDNGLLEELPEVNDGLNEE
jgi:hypothetical protein